MKRFFVAAMVFSFALAALSFAAGKANMELKAGDEIYACNCGEACKCDTMSRNEGKCTCGKDMVKAKLTKVEAGKSMLKAEKWEKEKAFKTTGKYVCACGEACKCDGISQNAGKCTCGKEMKKI